MALLVHNKSAAPVVLVGLATTVTVPASAAPPFRGEAVDVTSELRGLGAPAFAALEVQRLAVPLEYEWSAAADYATPGLTVISGGGVVPTGADSNITGATVDSGSLVGHETMLLVEAAAESKGAIDSAALLLSPTGQPSHPRTLAVVFDLGWDGGDITVGGVGPGGVAVTETFLNPGAGGGTVVGTKVFAKITTPNGIVNGTAGAGGKNATVQTSTLIGVAAAGAVAFTKLSVGGVDEAVSAFQANPGAFTPTTAPTGLLNYEIWYTFGHSHAVTDAGHTHTLS